MKWTGLDATEIARGAVSSPLAYSAIRMKDSTLPNCGGSHARLPTRSSFARSV
ncbi:hypothetical protein AKJ09_05722 [Labilithrix luteola]|uniref:Uncharacterized protein n=1 Tax=Labilithrix luteola TaxID=1391654 RepID=A0A0K1PZV5_9BACT|nr:hypothetical protein AKJ09_05722 [Labilithrix luteola]